MAGIVGTITNLSDFLSKTQVCLSVKPNDPQQQIICLEADRKYSIPAFQREVRWDDNNLKMLLYDLSRSSKFLGNIILTIKSDHTCEIIDGQQRTTVLIYARNRLDKDKSLSDAKNLEALGNKALLEKRINIRAADYRFTDKVKYYQGFTNSRNQKKDGTRNHELINLAAAADFTEDDIRNRTNQIMVEFLNFLTENDLTK